MRRIGVLVAQLAAFALSCSVQAQKYEIPRLPGAELLEESYLPDKVLLATEYKTTTLPEALVHGFLSISLDGKIVGAVRSIPSDSPRNPRHVISTYSVEDGRWTDYLEIHGFMGGFWGSSAVSPDGSKMAYVTRDSRTDFSGAHLSLRILEFRTGNVAVVSNPPREVRNISWSPDGRRIAFDMNSPSNPKLNYASEIRTINVVDVETGTVSVIGVGGTPSWSPSGEWIAYVGYVPADRAHSQPWSYYSGRYYATDDFELRLMSTVGTHSRRLMRLPSGPNLKPIWSPDSRMLLLNQLRDPDNGTFDVYLLDVVTGNATKRFRNVAPVYAWVAAK